LAGVVVVDDDVAVVVEALTGLLESNKRLPLRLVLVLNVFIEFIVFVDVAVDVVEVFLDFDDSDDSI
jgi:hypothetical protein